MFTRICESQVQSTIIPLHVKYQTGFAPRIFWLRVRGIDCSNPLKITAAGPRQHSDSWFRLHIAEDKIPGMNTLCG
jgi:hypothetical protein